MPAPGPQPQHRANTHVSVGVLGLFLACGHAALILLYTNVPAGVTGAVGFSHAAVALFREHLWLPALTLAPGSFGTLAAGAWTLLWAAYAALLWTLARAGRATVDQDGPCLRLVLVTIAVPHILLLVWMPPVLSADLFHYASLGQMALQPDLNPYVQGPVALGDVPIARLATWPDVPSHYGATFTWLSAALGWAGRGHALATAYAFKLATAAANIGCALLVRRLARAEGHDGTLALAAYGACPLFVVESAGSAHNEALMLLPALWGLWAWRQGRAAAGLAALTVGTLVKPVIGALALLVVVRDVWSADGTRARLWRLTQRAVLVGLLVALACASFGFDGGLGLGASASLVNEGRALRGGAAPDTAWPLAMWFGTLLGACVIAARMRRSHVIELAALDILVFVLVVFAWQFPWYFIPPAALALVAGPGPARRPLLVATFGLAVAFSYSYVRLVPWPPRATLGSASTTQLASAKVTVQPSVRRRFAVADAGGRNAQ